MSSNLMNRATINLKNGDTKDYNHFICFNLDVKTIDEENEEIYITKYVSTQLDVTQNKYANICVAKTCEAIMNELVDYLNSLPEEEKETFIHAHIDNLEDAKSITLRGIDKINVIKMGVCFAIDFLNEEDVKVTVHPTTNINTLGKMAYVLEIFANNINEALEKYKQIYNEEDISVNRIN